MVVGERRRRAGGSRLWSCVGWRASRVIDTTLVKQIPVPKGRPINTAWDSKKGGHCLYNTPQKHTCPREELQTPLLIFTHTPMYPSEGPHTLQRFPFDLSVRICEEQFLGKNRKMDAKTTLLQKNGTFKSGSLFRGPKNCRETGSIIS